MSNVSIKVLRDVLIAIGMCVLLWVFFLSFKPEFKKPGIDLALSIPNEEKLGEMIEESLATGDPGMKPLTNVYADSCIQVISQRLISHLDSSAYSYDIKVIESDEVNAFAIPGGKIFVCEGLLKFAHSAEEVAAVVAHEMGHVEGRHVVNKMIKELGISALFMILTDGNSGIIEELSGKVMSTYFDREQETEADMFGLKLLEKSGISPLHMSSVFARMNEHFGHADGPEFLSTHPALENRVEYTSQYIPDPAFEEELFQLDWKKFAN